MEVLNLFVVYASLLTILLLQKKYYGISLLSNVYLLKPKIVHLVLVLLLLEVPGWIVVLILTFMTLEILGEFFTSSSFLENSFSYSIVTSDAIFYRGEILDSLPNLKRVEKKRRIFTNLNYMISWTTICIMIAATISGIMHHL